MVTRQLERIVPREIDSEVKFTKFFSLTDLMIILLLFMVMSNFSSMVHPMLQMLYMLYSIIVGVVLIIPAGRNYPGKKIYHLILFVFRKPRMAYWSIDQYAEESEVEQHEII